MLLPAMQAPPALSAPAPTSQEAESALLEAFDWESALPPAPTLKGTAGLRYAWLRAAATFDPARDLPVSPFATGREHQEAEALRHLLRAPKAQLHAALKALPMRTSGTALALWRWGQLQVRSGAFDPALRQVWEDRLIAAGPYLTRGYGLRHALCWALAQQDEARFSRLRAAAGPASETMIQGFQRLFGWLGNPSPTLRLWSLPGLDYQDLRLDQLGGARVWIHPADADSLPPLPAGTAWIIPSASAGLDERAASLSEPILAEGQALAGRLQSAGRTAHFAPSQAAFEQLGLLWFPILIDLDGQGNIRSIRMGDAAPPKP
ncbi:hypothetical protein GETHLI_26140 [Geothrix limicola]|uniref:Uncharacterized protein n=1 Tax=Geothrix limicola TaxID=2927978 RepID=A0ABQ5QHF1_9BACT|nr:hypothetical protein [Geothrix limicola]GLH74112.1 hypothetical protein GETHLI_26140 [Geothrix limicola]